MSKNTTSTSNSIVRKLKVLAKEKESVRRELAVTAKKLAITAKEKESTRRKLEVTAQKLAITAKEKEIVRRKLEITAKKLAVTARELNLSYETLEGQVLERTKVLARAKAKDEAILASIGDGIIVADKKGKITYVNQAFEEMVGWKMKEVLGKYIVDVMPREDEKRNVVLFKERILTQVLSGEKVVADLTKPFYYIRKNKSRFPASSIVTSIILEGEIIGVVETFRDITKEKEIDKAKTEFVSLASHQLRTPLTTISWYTEMILSGDMGEVIPEQKKYLEEIYEGNQRMVDLVNTLLDVSRIELGTFMFEAKQTNIPALADSALDEQKLKIVKKNLVPLKNFSKNIPEFLTDQKLLRMVFQNLLTNAVAYTPQNGTIELAISFNKNEKTINIKVSDTGYGIPKNQQDKIFTRFFRADNVKAKETDGTGLGLYIVKSIVEHSGGKIWFESKENIGTTFHVALPLNGMGSVKS